MNHLFIYNLTPKFFIVNKEFYTSKLNPPKNLSRGTYNRVGSVLSCYVIILILRD